MSFGGFDSVEGLRGAAVRFMETAWRQRDPDAVRALAGPDYRYALGSHDDTLPIEGYLRLLATFQHAFDDLVLAVLETVAEGDHVALHLVLAGRHVRELFGIAARGSEGRLDLMTRLEFRDRRVHRQYAVTDFSTLTAIMRS
ncbi:MAG: ester cyclase [Pseudomonadales bacterium]|nr:ester cyclase [Pseudomonadales bacterium]